MRRVIGHWLDVVLGPRCICDARVYPKDQAAHDDLEHAGDGRG